ncbi:pyridoxamine 5'-phosphate oxidase [Plebeiibacterium marinum]|uniref:Pyridoxine/pyridoxamine 5'-phosphate oxidase n=1 Tax=Plebeiibacterium marinum TaxID=2992111 RepID=A0AAE3SKA1_9BACT|nr:pyridoxamine 5'-phosphate oxidase [Plebeiobacterium marinum]MCW3805255.1 pyridoxamine 5'-phosphate oxidase [Plebeiobacterium marinum]
MNRDLSQVRQDFLKMKLDEGQFIQHPVIHVKEWLNEAIKNNIQEPTAATLATVSEQNRPSSRVILIKHIDELSGFWFFTNYLSRKGKQLELNHFGSLNFFWPQLERQIRIEGKVEKLSPEQSDVYFNSRPKDSKISAIISEQSQFIKSRKILENKFQSLKSSNKTLIRPQHWGGYSLIPDMIEFWQGRAGRLHDRIVFEQNGNNWNKTRLAP